MGFWSWFRNLVSSDPPPRRDRDDKPLVALVLFLAEPRDLDAASIARYASRALGVRFTFDEPEADDNFVTGEEPSFILRHGDHFYLINNFPRPYMDDPEAAAAAVGELRLRKAIREHSAWLSVDLLGEVRRSELPQVYRIIGKLTAALSGDDCLAIIAPATGQLNVFDSETTRLLCSDDPLDLFDVASHPPVVPVRGNDPRLKAAVAKARKRWPEFVAAFEERRADQSFSVKARIGDDDVCEFMWISVTGLENGWIYGRLDNDPIEILSVRCGDRIRIQVDHLNDWIYTDGDHMRGGFTIEVLRQIQDEMQSGPN